MILIKQFSALRVKRSTIYYAIFNLMPFLQPLLRLICIIKSYSGLKSFLHTGPGRLTLTTLNYFCKKQENQRVFINLKSS